MKMKKIIAGLSAMAMASMMFASSANAAAINDATAAFDGTLSTGQTITITSAGNFDGDDITSATIKELDGTSIATTFTYGDDTSTDTSVITIATANITDNKEYVISFTTAGGDFGVTQISAGTPTSDTVNVSATVEPILSMDIASTQVVYTANAAGVLTVTSHHFKAGDSVIVKEDIDSSAVGATYAYSATTTVTSVTATTITLTATGDLTDLSADDGAKTDVIELASSSSLGFGVLSADTLASISHDVVVNTNATSGYTVQVANVGLNEDAGDGVIPAADTSENLATAGNYGYGINASVDAGVDVDGDSSEAGTIQGTFGGGTAVVSPMGAAANLVVGDGVANQQRTTVNIQTKISSLQEAGAYADVITYTITGTF